MVSLAVARAGCFIVSASARRSHGQYDETFRDIQGVVKELHLDVFRVSESAGRIGEGLGRRERICSQ